MDAHGALDSLLGRLTSVLVNEAQLLGGLRGDVEFIRDEMESMNGLLLHLTEAQHRDHQVRAWMKQVIGLTRDCDGNVELYVHYIGGGAHNHSKGILGYLQRIPRFLQTMAVRRRTATRIQELKIRARDVGDRRQRYGVTVPASTRADMDAVDVEPSVGEEDLRRRAVLLGSDEPPVDDSKMIRSVVDTMIKCLSAEPETTGYRMPKPRVRVFNILWDRHLHEVVEGVYQQHSYTASRLDCKARSNGRDVGTVLAEILEQVRRGQGRQRQGEDKVTNLEEARADEDREKQLISEIRRHLNGKRFLILVTDYYYGKESKRILDALLHAADECRPGSSIIMTTRYDDKDLALLSSPYKVINTRDLGEFYRHKLLKLNADYILDTIDDKDLVTFSAFARKMLLHLLYVKPTMTAAEQDMFRNAISKGMRLHKNVDHTMVMLCYSELPSRYRSCLLYLTIFPQGHVIKTTRLARRWVAEGLLTATSGDETESAVDKADHYWDVLFIRGFISPVEISAAGNIKSFTLQDEVHKVIVQIARDLNIFDTNLPTDLARHLSIHNRIGLVKSHSSGGDRKDIAAFLPSLAASPQWQLLKVLDLEGCHGLDKQHLKSICKILLLKYLSLRNTDVEELPKQIKGLQCLETLDIRQTKVRVLAKKPTVLPRLKHFLAGHKVSAIHDSRTSQDSISAVQMPHCIQKMENMEVLSHVQVSNKEEIDIIAKLRKLRKLGVALHGKNAKLSDLFHQIEEWNVCLRSLSIRVDAGMIDPLCSTPQFIERLNISGITSGLGHLIQEHHKLTKITLCEAQLKEDDLAILGKLRSLHSLRLQHNSYTEREIVFRGGEFQIVNYLLIEGKDITKVRFCSGGAPKLERIVWSFNRMDALSGLYHLTKLKEVELNGDFDVDSIEEELFWHPKGPTLKHKPLHQCQGDRSAAPTTPSSSAP